jgi:hypothetical protein
MKIRTYRQVSFNGAALESVTLPEPEPIDIPSWMYAACGSIVAVDDVAPGRVRVTGIKGTRFEPFVAVMPEAGGR